MGNVRADRIGRAVGQRNLSLDLLKLVLAMMVVGLHAAALPELGPAAADFLHDGLFRIAVPAFFVINGYYLEAALSHRPGKWFVRIACLYVLWSAAYLPLMLKIANGDGVRLAEFLLTGFWHLWYVHALFFGGLMVWIVLHGNLRKASGGLLAALASAAFAVGVFLQYAATFGWFGADWFGADPAHNWVYRNFLFVAFPFLVCGILIARRQAADPWRTGTGPLLALALLLVAGEWNLNYRLARPDAELDILASLFLAAPVLVLWASGVGKRTQGNLIGKISAAIYFSHVAVLYTVQARWQLAGTEAALATLAASALLAPPLIWLNRRLPVL